LFDGSIIPKEVNDYTRIQKKTTSHQRLSAHSLLLWHLAILALLHG
jgi:hypothetical protein